MTTAPKTRPRKTDRRINPEYLHNAALYYLQRYAATTGRVRHVLTEKIKRSCRDHPDQILADLIPLIETEIEKLTRIELLNDERLGSQLVEGWRGRGVSTRMISIRLQKKGFDAPTITTLLASAPSETNDAERCAALRYLKRRKLPPFVDTKTPDREQAQKIRSKAWAALARQGYSPDLIDDVMKATPEQIDDWLLR